MVLFTDSGRNPRQFSATDSLPYIKVWGRNRAVELKSLNIQVKVTGLFAETTQTMQFHNPNPRELEGNLTFPLPDGATVCGYGLDVDGVMVDGVVVPKKKARQILEAEERKGADPGLLEQVQGNVYQTRIYPIPANGTRTVKITYASRLSVAGNEATYHLPLQHTSTVKDVSLRIEVRQSSSTPLITGGQGNMTMTAWSQAWVAEATLNAQLITDDLRVRLPDLPDTYSMTETVPNGDTFFCISQNLPTVHDQEKWLPNRVAIAWDASGSRTDIGRDLELLGALFKAWQHCIIDVVVFRNRLDERISTFAVEQGDAQELFNFLQSLPCDGATDLSVLNFGVAPVADIGAWLLFTDGLDTFDQQLPKTGNIPVMPVVNAFRRNVPVLQHLAEKTGGRVIDLRSLAATQAAREIQTYQAASKIVSAEGCEKLYLQVKNRRLLISGIMFEPIGKIALRMPSGDICEMLCNRENAVEGRVLAREWAGRRIQELSVFGESEGEESILLSRQFGIVSPGTSLLVLESIDQYLEYDIEPPESLPELRKAFSAWRKRRKAKHDKKAGEQIERVVKLWQDRVEWWNTDFHTRYDDVRKRKQIEGIEEGLPVSRQRGDMRAASDDVVCYESLESPHSAVEYEALDCERISPSLDGHIHESLDMSEATGWRPAPAARAATRVKAWDPDVPYLQTLKTANKGGLYQAYLQQRPEYCQSPSFFLDCGDYFLSAGETAKGLLILSNLLEFGLEGVDLLRVYSWRLQQAGLLDEAIRILEYVQKKRDDEPQSHRDLALALAERWEKTGDAIDAIRAMELLYLVIRKAWDRFPEIELIALMELNRLTHLAEAKDIPIPDTIDERLRQLLDLDLRISMSWDADNTDIDLHVFEPDGSHAYYASNRTDQGGLVSYDFRDGYGPEEYVLKKALPGKYRIKAHYFGTRKLTPFGPCTVKVDVFTNYGRTDEARHTLTLRLEESGGEFVVGEVTIDNDTSSKKSEIQIPTIEDFRKITSGMDMGQVVSLVGTPHRVIQQENNGVLLLEYRLNNECHIQIGMKFTVVEVNQLVGGAVVKMV